jgi:hypothetical protein
MDHHLEKPVSTYGIKVSQKHCKNRSRIRKTNNNQKSNKDVEGSDPGLQSPNTLL